MSTNKLLIIPAALVTTTLLIGLILLSTITKADGNTNVTDTLNITVNSACTMMGGPTGESTTDNTYTATIDPGTYSEISGSKLVTVCNDNLGYSIYAIGFSGDSYDTDNTKLLGQGLVAGTNINTGTTGTNSYWAMKLEAVQGLTPPTIETGWNDYHVIPDTYTQIAEQGTSTASSSDAGASVQTKYKVNISSSQTAGSYQGKVKYTMVHPNDAPAPSTKLYMQDLTLADCQSSASSDNLTVTDRRDENDYTVKYINGQCWMTQNLRLTGTVYATDSNFSGSDLNLSQYSLDSNDSSYTDHCDGYNGYDFPCTKDSGSETTGVWYNYYAATARTISGSSNTNPATADICPSGWHLPSAPNTTANTDIKKLVGNTTSGWQNPTPSLTSFGAVAGGTYYNGSLNNPESGRWWSATADIGTSRYYLIYNSSDGQFRGDGSSLRRNGYFLRCVKSA